MSAGPYGDILDIFHRAGQMHSADPISAPLTPFSHLHFFKIQNIRGGMEDRALPIQ
jgi:hypothetical protein